MLMSFRVSAPSKLILHGEHSVCYNKTAVATALDLRTCITFTRVNEGDSLEINFDDLNVTHVYSLNELRTKIFSVTTKDDVKRITQVVTKVVEESLGNNDNVTTHASQSTSGVDDVAKTALVCFFVLLRTVLDEPPALHLDVIQRHVKSSIPIGAGLGSSAALSVCLAAGLSVMDNEEQKNSLDLNRVCELSLLSDRIVHGPKASGVDSAVSSFGGLIRFQTLKSTSIPSCPQLSKLRILLVDTCVQRQTRAMLDNVASRYSQAPEVITPVLESMDAIAIRSMEYLANCILSQEEVYEELRKLVFENQKLLELLKVSHPRLEQVCRVAWKHDMSAKLTGGGGGGFAFILIDPSASEYQVEALMKELTEQGFKCWQTQLGAKGVQFEQLT